MPLAGHVTDAADGAIGFDTALPLALQTAQAYVARGYKFCVRYVSRTDASRQHNQVQGRADLSPEEGQLILDTGLALMVVQHVAATGWVPTEALGASYGAAATSYTALAGVPAGVTVWLDLEDIPRGTPHRAITQYANAWYDAVASGGFVPGVYVGFNVWLSPDELFFDLKFRHYWRADGNIPDIAHRGYQLFQHVLDAGTPDQRDKNVARADALGGRATWLAPLASGGV